MAVRIGMMSFAHMHAYSYAHCVKMLESEGRAQLVGVADHDPERGKQAAQQYDTRFFESYEDLLDAGVDAVIVCPENVRHRPLTEMAAQAGKHVLCEKPLATSKADGRAMIEACKAHSVQLMTAFPCRFSPSYIRLKQMVQAGELGEVLAIRGTNRGRNPGGWFIVPELSGGGAVIDHTVHVTDLCRDLLGSEVVEVYAEISNGFCHGDFDDTGMLTLTFANDVFATLDSSWSRPKVFPTWGDVTLQVVGTKGLAYMDMFAQNSTLYDDREMRITLQHWGSNIDYGLVSAFVESVATGKPVPITGEDGLAAAEVAFAAYESAKRGEPVRLPLPE
ncbi:MAG: Gfo/Idh/MocA family oxidoreductase [Armatimonadota bacterium]|nr:Gfo/Idh/MocA family oxidoreductase [bacterium]MDW8290523.1 Gfo/Idh/MocA family oxidoreductase [Armatimonadota bacterium]